MVVFVELYRSTSTINSYIHIFKVKICTYTLTLCNLCSTIIYTAVLIILHYYLVYSKQGGKHDILITINHFGNISRFVGHQLACWDDRSLVDEILVLT